MTSFGVICYREKR